MFRELDKVIRYLRYLVGILISIEGKNDHILNIYNIFMMLFLLYIYIFFVNMICIHQKLPKTKRPMLQIAQKQNTQ